MAEEMTEPVQAVPEEEAPKQEAPRPEGPALTVLTVLLVLVGAADLALWGLAGFYFFGNL